MVSRRVSFFLLWLSWIFFFVAQVFLKYEILLTVLSIVFSLFLLLRRESGEVLLFLVGFATGLIIEVGLGLVTRTQHWENASFFGVPYWLPVIWGYGFVVMRRIGNLIVEWAKR